MSQIVLFHSALGVRPGVLDAAQRLGDAGHEVLVVDQYDGRTFDTQEEAGRFVDSIGFPELMRRALVAVEDLDDGFVAMGFSNGAGMAEYVATQRRVAGAVLLSGALPLGILGSGPWPAGVPAQLHYAIDDPYRNQEWVDALVAEIGAVAPIETFDYACAGHLFTDPSLPDEYDAGSAGLLWTRVVDFCDGL
jgi:dienelactone hydrolase